MYARNFYYTPTKPFSITNAKDEKKKCKSESKLNSSFKGVQDTIFQKKSKKTLKPFSLLKPSFSIIEKMSTDFQTQYESLINGKYKYEKIGKYFDSEKNKGVSPTFVPHFSKRFGKSNEDKDKAAIRKRLDKWKSHEKSVLDLKEKIIDFMRRIDEGKTYSSKANPNSFWTKNFAKAVKKTPRKPAKCLKKCSAKIRKDLSDDTETVAEEEEYSIVSGGNYGLRVLKLEKDMSDMSFVLEIDVTGYEENEIEIDSIEKVLTIKGIKDGIERTMKIIVPNLEDIDELQIHPPENGSLVIEAP